MATLDQSTGLAQIYAEMSVDGDEHFAVDSMGPDCSEYSGPEDAIG